MAWISALADGSPLLQLDSVLSEACLSPLGPLMAYYLEPSLKARTTVASIYELKLSRISGIHASCLIKSINVALPKVQSTPAPTLLMMQNPVQQEISVIGRRGADISIHPSIHPPDYARSHPDTSLWKRFARPRLLIDPTPVSRNLLQAAPIPTPPPAIPLSQPTPPSFFPSSSLIPLPWKVDRACAHA